jgi:bacterioferritin
MKSPFNANIAAIRRGAREKIAEGAVTAGYLADREQVISVLNDALATEIVCTLRYKNHYYVASGILSKPVADEFLEHAAQEAEHADWIAERITQLGGVPNFNPAGLADRSHSEYKEESRLEDMLREDLVAERIAIQTYTEIIRWLGDGDPTSRRLMERILEVEEEHAEDLKNLLDRMGN